MDLRTAALALVLFPVSASLTAQQDPQGQQPAADPAAEAAQEPAQQDPDRPSKTPAERIGELEDERAALVREIEFVRARVAKAGQVLRSKLSERELTFRAIDAGRGSVSPVAAAPVQTKKAKLMTKEQLAGYGQGVMLIVDERPVFRSEYDQLMKYLEEVGTLPTEQNREQRAMLELLRIESTIGQFPEAASDALAFAQEAQQALAEGGKFEDVANRYSGGPLVKNAELTITRNCPFGLFLEKAVFETEAGQRTPIVKGLTGYVIFQIDEVSKGERRAMDSAKGRIIMVPYHPDQAVLDKARAKAAMGQVTLGLSDRTLIEKLPPMMRPSSFVDDSGKEKPLQKQDKDQDAKTDAEVKVRKSDAGK